MVFSSLLFLFIYLPVVLGIYFITPIKWRNGMILIANLIFYGWGEPFYIILMILSILVAYLCGLFTEKYRADDKKARLFVGLSVIFNLGLLIFFKYFDFIVSNLLILFPFLDGVLHPLALTLPIGISFYTFQIMSYNIDLYRKDAPLQKSVVAFATYVTLFPQLIAGPIVRYKDVADQMADRNETVEKFASGIGLFVIGLSKKVLLANNIGALWDAYKSSGGNSVMGAWLGAFAFSLQLYFDFSGYSDMARGLGRMLGFEFLENFNYPYISKSITEFWRRWHISLGTWFREYVYIPMGGNRKGIFATYRNIFIVWALTGIWHGAEWNFMLWGVYFAVLLIIEKAFLLKWLQKLPAFVQHCYAVFLIVISWMLFAVEGNIAGCIGYVKTMLGLSGAAFIDTKTMYYFMNFMPVLLICLLASTPIAAKLYEKLSPKIKQPVMLAFIFGGLVLCTAYLVDASYNPFLYFRF